MKTLALILFFCVNSASAAGYEKAIAAIKNIDDALSKELGTIVTQPGTALAQNARVAAMLADNQAALELFRQTVQDPNNGYLFAPKPEKLSASTPVPQFKLHLQLFRLIVIEAKIAAVRKQRALVEKDLLAATGFLVQLSAQKRAVLLTALVEQLCMRVTYPLLSDSLRGAASPAYLAGQAFRLDRLRGNQDFLQRSMMEEYEILKNTILDGQIAAMVAEESKKLPFWNRLVMKRLMDKEFVALVEKQISDGLAGRTKVWIRAFRANDVAAGEAYINKQLELYEARKKEREQRSSWTMFKAGLRNPTLAKSMIGEEVSDFALFGGVPNYGKLVPRYSLYYSQLNVLRTGLAVKLYQRGNRRLPGSLDQLVPAHLGAVPQDPFNKFAPLSYARAGKKFAVYGFGPDGADGQGAAALDLDAYDLDPVRNAGDVVFAD